MAANGIRERLETTKLPHGVYLAALACVAMLAALVSSSVIDSGESNLRVGIILSFALNSIIGVVFLVEEMLLASISLKLVHWIFYLTFLCIAPLTQELYGYEPWGYHISSSDILLSNAIVFLWGILFRLFAGTSRSNSKKITYDQLIGSLPTIRSCYLFFLFIISIASAALVVRLVGIDNLFSVSDYANGLDKTVSLLFETIVRPIPLFSTAVAVVYSRQQARFSPWIVIFLVLALLVEFPSAIPRFAMACQYGGLAILMFKPLIDRRGLFAAVFLVAFLIIFPAANIFKWDGFEVGVIADSLIQTVANIPSGFCAVDYDAYSMIPRTMAYVSEAGTTVGNSLLTVLLFFVPRAYWSGKAEASGEIVAAYQGQAFTNLACPLPAEGYINFGLIGCLVFAIAYGLICKKMDATVFENSGMLAFVYCFLVPISFYLLRGALLSGWAYTFGYSVMLTILMLGARVFGKKRSPANTCQRETHLANTCSERRRLYE